METEVANIPTEIKRDRLVKWLDGIPEASSGHPGEPNRILITVKPRYKRHLWEPKNTFLVTKNSKNTVVELVWVRDSDLKA